LSEQVEEDLGATLKAIRKKVDEMDFAKKSDIDALKQSFDKMTDTLAKMTAPKPEPPPPTPTPQQKKKAEEEDEDEREFDE